MKKYFVLALALFSLARSLPPGIVYSPLDSLSRPGPAFALLTPESLPDAPSSSIRGQYPAGFQTLQFSGIPSGGWLYNRTHLIGSLLGGSSALENLATCTQYLNQTLMYPLETQVYSYLASSSGPVLYAVIPVYQDQELLPRSLFLLALSLGGPALRITERLPNVQPGILIDYADGSACLAPSD